MPIWCLPNPSWPLWHLVILRTLDLAAQRQSSGRTRTCRHIGISPADLAPQIRTVSTQLSDQSGSCARVLSIIPLRISAVSCATYYYRHSRALSVHRFNFSVVFSEVLELLYHFIVFQLGFVSVVARISANEHVLPQRILTSTTMAGAVALL